MRIFKLNRVFRRNGAFFWRVGFWEIGAVISVLSTGKVSSHSKWICLLLIKKKKKRTGFPIGYIFIHFILIVGFTW